MSNHTHLVLRLRPDCVATWDDATVLIEVYVPFPSPYDRCPISQPSEEYMKSTIHNTAFIGAVVCIALVACPLSAADVITVLPNGEVRVAGSAPSAPAPGEVTIGGGHLAAAGTVTSGNMVVGRTSQAAGAEAVRGDDARLIPVGTLLPFAGSTAPAGWLLCDGSAVSRAAYPALFSTLGGRYGYGDGSSTFNLPDFRGRMPIGAGQGPGLSPRAIGQAGGEESHRLTSAEMPSHNHGLTFYLNGDYQPPNDVYTPFPGYHTGTAVATTSTAGSDQPHNVMNPFMVVHFIVKF